MLNEKKVRISFQRIRADQVNAAQWIAYLKERLDELSVNVAQLHAAQDAPKFTEESVETSKGQEMVQQQFTEPIEQLTDQQKKTLFLIGSLQRERQASCIPVRLLNAELYGPQNIQRMQTTVANYLKRLEELHLITRNKKGRHSYVTLSENGLKAMASHHVEQMKTVLQ